MSGRRYKAVIDRDQITLFPQSLDEYIAGDNPVRAIDAYVESLDLDSFGFMNTGDELTAGQPAYPPSALLKLYVYGYLNRVRSSRRLEKETHRNVEVMWLVQGLKPSYKTIADFRKDNAKALRKINKDFVVLCKELDLFGGELAGIDGSFFRASASKGSIYTQKRLEKEQRKIEKDIERYLEQLNHSDESDEEQGLGSLVDDAQLVEKLEELKHRQQAVQAKLKAMEERGEKQYSETDPDARLLTKRGHTIAGYNVQQSIDDKHKLIAVEDVTNDGNDVQQLEPMAKQTQAILESEELIVVADSGYYNPEQIKECCEAGITPYVAITDKSKPIEAQGRFTRDQFQFDAEHNLYRCPAGQWLRQIGQPYKKSGRIMMRYTSKAKICDACEQKSRCLPEKSQVRQINRWEHEEVIDAHRKRMEEGASKWMRKRAELAEHPFGTIKRWFGWDHFLVRGFDKVKGEMSLMVLGYNLTRVLKILGTERFRDYCASKQRVAQEGLLNTFAAC